ncbi:hypothetical protein, partial [Mesorhizobium sp.]
AGAGFEGLRLAGDPQPGKRFALPHRADAGAARGRRCRGGDLGLAKLTSASASSAIRAEHAVLLGSSVDLARSGAVNGRKSPES